MGFKGLNDRICYPLAQFVRQINHHTGEGTCSCQLASSGLDALAATDFHIDFQAIN